MTVSNDVRDVIVVGGGHNGLACASYLARGGLDVLVVEQHQMPGGAAVTEEPWPGYRVSTASYVVSLMPERIVGELELRRFGYKTTILEPDYFVPYEDGSYLSLWGDTARCAREIAKFSAADAAAYVEFDAYLSRLGHLIHELLYVVPPNLSMKELPRWAAVGAKLRGWTGRDINEVVRLFTVSGADFLDEWFEDERVKGALGTQAILGGWNGPMSPGSAYVLLHHWMGEIDGQEGAWGWVQGGMGAVGRVLAESAQAAGAEIMLGAQVRKVALVGNRAEGVELEDGRVLKSRWVVSNAHPVTTLRDLVGDAHLPDEVVRDLKRFRSRSGAVKVNLALSELPVPKGWKGPVPGDPHTGILAISPSLEYLERAWDDAKYGHMSKDPYIEAVFPTVFEPGLAPEGKHIALCFTQFGPYELAEGSWDTERKTYADNVINTLTRVAPNVAGSVIEAEVLTPKDIEDRFGLLGGNIFQGDMTPEQMFCFRPIPGYADHRSPIESLFMCGSGTHPGGGVMGVPGRNCAEVVLKAAKRARMRERVRERLGRS
jgi:phytoene dehydrogenase-like protein